jgi:hypothetical protein
LKVQKSFRRRFRRKRNQQGEISRFDDPNPPSQLKAILWRSVPQ